MIDLIFPLMMLVIGTLVAVFAAPLWDRVDPYAQDRGINVQHGARWYRMMGIVVAIGGLVLTVMFFAS